MIKTINTYQNGKIGRLFRQVNGDYLYALELGESLSLNCFPGKTSER